MSRVFFTSDLHFGHESLCRALRGMSAKESDELIIHNWNSVVTKRDRVYVLGDFTMEKRCDLDILKQLKGDIVIVGGNNDVLRCCREYQYLGIPVMGCLQYKGFFCTHVPIHPHELDFCRGNIHGHIHRKGVIDGWEYNPQSLGERYFNVNTEFHNYTPVLFDEIEQYFINLNT